MLPPPCVSYALASVTLIVSKCSMALFASSKSCPIAAKVRTIFQISVGTVGDRVIAFKYCDCFARSAFRIAPKSFNSTLGLFWSSVVAIMGHVAGAGSAEITSVKPLPSFLLESIAIFAHRSPACIGVSFETSARNATNSAFCCPDFAFKAFCLRITSRAPSSS